MSARARRRHPAAGLGDGSGGAAPGGEPPLVEYASAAPDPNASLRQALDVHPDDSQGFDRRWASVLASGEAFERTVRLRRRDGVYRWFLVLVAPERDEDGGIRRWAGTATDIDDLQRAYRAADRLRLILDSVVEAIIVFDPVTFRIEEVNRGALVLLGRSRDQLAGLSMDALLREADVERLVAVVGTLAGGQADATTVMLEYQPAKGGSIAVEVVLQSVELPDGARAIVAIARDIRDRIEAQVRLQRLAEAEHARAAELNAVIRAMGEAVVVCTIDGTITLDQPGRRRALPRARSRGPTTTSCDSSPIRTGRLRTSASGRSDRSCGPPETRSAGSSCRPTRCVSGATLAPTADETIVMMRDVTQARRLEAVRQTFIGVLSHELRTPVTTIFGGAKLLARPNSNLDPRDEARDLPRHPRGGRAAAAAGRGRRRAQSIRRGRRRDRLGAGPRPAAAAPGRAVRGRPLAGRHVRARRRDGPADRERRSDLRRAGRPQPAVERREVRRRWTRRSRSGRRPESAR